MGYLSSWLPLRRGSLWRRRLRYAKHCYNIADVVNKTAFGMMIWYAATVDTAAAESED